MLGVGAYAKASRDVRMSSRHGWRICDLDSRAVALSLFAILQGESGAASPALVSSHRAAPTSVLCALEPVMRARVLLFRRRRLHVAARVTLALLVLCAQGCPAARLLPVCGVIAA